MDIWHQIWPYVAALLPTIGLCFLFYEVMKHIVEGDRRERAAVAEWEAGRGAATSKSGSSADNSLNDDGLDFHGDHY